MPIPTSSINGRFIFNEFCSFADVTLPNDCVSDDQIEAGSNVDHLKLQHRHTISDYVAAPDDSTIGIHVCDGDGAVISIDAVLIGTIPSGDKAIAVDLQRSTAGGAFATVLSAPITLNSADTIRVINSGTISSPTLVAGDILAIVLDKTGSTGTDPAGLVFTVTITSDGV